ncbi:hypothetical protein THAOC_30259 [Thalassiosira oceanica]|uniref:Uncharacterized protein n=1 Tax=Thalassiosira oceanica TaxID=159749 RepID=K0REQ5_THAOC|nr:hypothetical protein THAOC_30259 [Thalassiosira oceanica]|eukprot:EJK50699.1 hypothetical protein THAOC_30259 [Thalassiosira oceanica]
MKLSSAALVPGAMGRKGFETRAATLHIERLRLHCSRERWRRDKVGLCPYERECLDWPPQRQAQVTYALVSAFIATKQWCKDKVRLCPYKRECLDTALLVGTSSKGSPNHLSEVEITTIEFWQDEYRVLITEVLSGDYITEDHSEGRLEVEYTLNRSCKNDQTSTSNVAMLRVEGLRSRRRRRGLLLPPLVLPCHPLVVPAEI